MSADSLWELLRSGKPFFIAEAGVNHLGSLALGERLIKEAADAGASAIKFQSYKAKNLCTRDAPRFWDWDGEVEEEGSQFDSYSHLDSFGEREHHDGITREVDWVDRTVYFHPRLRKGQIFFNF